MVIYLYIQSEGIHYAHKTYHTGKAKRFERLRKKNVVAGII